MSDYDTPEQIRTRRNMFSRFARLQAIQEEKRRPKIQLEAKPKLPNEEHYNTWRSEEEQKEYNRKELEYILPYTAEYSSGEPRPSTSSSSDEAADNNQQDDCQSEIGTEISTTETQSSTGTVVNADSVGAMNKLGSRRTLRGQGGGQASEVETDEPSVLVPCSVRPIMVHPPVAEKKPQPSPKAPSTCKDFDQTSTIMPPSEVAATASDYNSNITIPELRQSYFARGKYEHTKSLPIYRQRREIIDAINSYSVVIIEGVTGCGKTTQVPMYILEDAILDRPSDKGAPVIYVTQPRRIAAKSIAERVCHEHGWQMPGIVGYQVSLEKEVGSQTVLVFCTAGVLLQKIIQEKSLKNYTHIIIDEAHERDADTDLLMMMIRKLMLTEMPFFRLVIMSATMDIPKLRRYFTFKTLYGHKSETSPSYIDVSEKNRSATNLQTIYLDTLRAQFGVSGQIPEFDMENPELLEDCLHTAVKIIVEVIPLLDNYNEETKSTLVFLPGMAEIARLDAAIKKYEGATDNLDIIPLHSCLTVADQCKVFHANRPGCRKVILATNIAESSITVQDVGFIVDFCLTKVLMKDTVTRFPTLKLQWATQDKCTQRAGRTGRCCPGKVFRMVPSNHYRQFRQYADPELLVAPLEISVLRVKNFNMGEIKALFAIVMDPPPLNEIRTAVLELKQIGALAATYRGQLSDIDGDLTELGRVITNLPIDVHLSKLIVIASAFDVLDDAIIVAACLSTNRTVVRFMYGNSFDSYIIKLKWASGSQSDLFVSLDCFKEFAKLKDYGKGDRFLEGWCRKNHLDERKLHDVLAMVEEIKSRLKNVNIFSGVDQPNRQPDRDMDYLMLKLSFAAAFYPNYFITTDLDVERITKELCGLNPLRTVVMSAIPVNRVPIYKTQIIERLPDSICKDLEFISDVSRAYLVLSDEVKMSQEGTKRVKAALKDDGDDKPQRVVEDSREIPIAMYKALKFGESQDIEIREYQEDTAFKRMNFYLKQRDDIAQNLPGRLIPSLMKVLDEDQQADNSRLIAANDAEYAEMTAQHPCFEVNCDVESDALDMAELKQVEDHERRQPSNAGAQHKIWNSNYRRVRGPDSPIRMSFKAILVKSAGYQVEVDGQSVNSILLDSEWRDRRRQMLVAATVTQSKSGRVSARDTTLMPNIRGLPTIMALLFAQYYRLIYNKELNCIAGGVFGLGWTKHDDQPLDRQYEIDLSFDVHMTTNDIELINSARRMISELMKFTEINNAGKPQATIQRDLRDAILTLIRRRRHPMMELDMSLVDYPDEHDNIFIKDVHNLPEDVLEEGAMRPFLPLMRYTREYSEKQLYETIRKNLDQLVKIEKELEAVPPGGIKCLLCGGGQKFRYIGGFDVEKHMRSERHQQNLVIFEESEERVRKQIAIGLAR